tara:strand:+ start:420 stop:830 length:411 start_codon:yes stop_codon:yes gene_type:complete
MKILTAEFDIPGYKKELVDVKELMLTNDTNYMMKRYDKLEISMDRVGMIYPILYTDLDSYWMVEKRWPKYENGNPIPGIAVHTGNKRVWWAKQNGYDKIEGIYVNSKAEQVKLVKITHIPHGNLPHYRNSYGRGRR